MRQFRPIRGNFRNWGMRLLLAGGPTEGRFLCPLPTHPTTHTHTHTPHTHPHTPTPIRCTLRTDGRSPTNKKDHSTTNAPRNTATMRKSKEAPCRGAGASAAATVRVPRNGKFGRGESHIGPLNAGKSSRVDSSRPIDYFYGSVEWEAWHSANRRENVSADAFSLKRNCISHVVNIHHSANVPYEICPVVMRKHILASAE